MSAVVMTDLPPLEELPRVFVSGLTRWPDPNRHVSAKEAVALLVQNDETLRGTTLLEPYCLNGEKVYELKMPPVGVKG